MKRVIHWSRTVKGLFFLLFGLGASMLSGCSGTKLPQGTPPGPVSTTQPADAEKTPTTQAIPAALLGLPVAIPIPGKTPATQPIPATMIGEPAVLPKPVKTPTTKPTPILMRGAIGAISSPKPVKAPATTPELRAKKGEVAAPSK